MVFGLSLLAGFSIGLGMPHLGGSVHRPEAIAQQTQATLIEITQQASDHYSAARFPQAEALWLAAVNRLANQPDAVLQRVQALSNLSLSQQAQADWENAQENINLALSLFGIEPTSVAIQAEGNDSETMRVLAQSLDIRGQLYYLTGNPQKALADWQQTQQIYEQLYEQLTGYRESALKSLLNQAQAYQALGQYLRAERNLKTVEESLLGLDRAFQLVVLQSLAQTERLLGKLDAAIQHLKQAIELLGSNITGAEQRFQLSQLRLELGNAQYALAIRDRDLNKSENRLASRTFTALETYQTVVQLAQSATQPSTLSTPKLLELQGLLNQLRLRLAFAAFPNILDPTDNGSHVNSLVNKTETLLADADLPVSRKTLFARIQFAELLANLAEAQTKSENPLRAISQEFRSTDLRHRSLVQLETALTQARTVQDLRVEASAVGQLGELYSQVGELYNLEQQSEMATRHRQDAKLFLKDAIAISSAAHAPDIRYRWHRQMGKLLKQEGNIDSALNAYRAAVGDLKQVRNDLLTVDTGVQFSFRDDVEPVYRELMELLVKTADSETSTGQDRITEVLEKFDELQLAEINNFLGCDSGQKIKLDLVKDPKAAIIYAITLSDRIAIVLDLPAPGASEERQKLLLANEIPLQDRTDTQQAIDLIQVIKEFQAAAADVFEEERAKELSGKIYHRFFWPIENAIQDAEIETLVFVLDGDLRNTSLAALQDEEGQYLIEKYNLAVTPGIDLFEPKSLPTDLTILLGGIKEPQLDVEGVPVRPIPRLEEELSAIQDLARIQKTLIGATFNSSNIAQNLQTAAYSVIHFKTHGQFSSDPQETFIVGFQELIRGRELGNLIQSGNLDEARFVDLLTLSSCQAAQGDNRSILGLTGIAVRAGARSVVSALWNADNFKTIELMTRFYQELFNSAPQDGTQRTTRASALRTAQLELLQGGARLNEWAPYVLVGNWN